jgi:two-component system phosphate regulon response regulator PhoB
MARVLVVDDDPMIRRLVSVKLTRCGHDVLEAGDGDDGLETALRERPDVVLLDWTMPKRNGEEVCSALRVAYDPVLFLMTGRSAAGAPEEHPAGPDAYLQKPFSPTALAQRIDAALAARHVDSPVSGRPGPPV